MDRNIQKRIEEIRRIIENSTYEELKNIRILEENKAIAGVKNDVTIFYVPKEYVHDLKLSVNETMQLRRSKNETEKEKREQEEDIALNLGSSNYRKTHTDVLDNFSENGKYYHKKIRSDRKARTKRKNIKKKVTNNNRSKFNKAKEKKIKKIRNIIIALAISGTAINVAATQISKAKADAEEYNYVASTVENLNEDDIAKKAEEILKEEISKATGEKVEDISFSDSWTDSSTHIAKIEAGGQEYRYVEDLRGGDVFGNNTMSKNIYNLILEMNNAKGKDRKEVIRALKDSMNFSSRKDIVLKGGKLVEAKLSTEDSLNNKENDREER